MRLSCLVAVAFFAAGCGEHERVIPWKLLPPSHLSGPSPQALVPPLPLHARFCRAPDVRFTSNGTEGINSSEGAMGFRVANTGRKTCALRGRPIVTVLSTGGYPVKVEQLPGTFGDARRAERTFGLAPGRSAYLTIIVQDLCVDHGKQTNPALVALTAARRTIRIPLSTCTPGLTLELQPFQPFVPERSPTVFPVNVKILGHPHARRGTTLAYRVRLKSTAKRAWHFPWCPLFTERIDHQNGPAYVLNCADVGTLRPGGRIVFEMRYRLSRYYRAGTHVLHWELTGADLKAQAADTAPLQVVR